MKVLQINAVNAVASTGRNVRELNEFLIRNDHCSFVAYSKGPSVNPKCEYKIGNKLDTKIHGLLSRVTGKQGYFSKGATKKLLRFMDKLEPDLVVLNNLHGNYINLPLLLTYLAKKNIVTVAVLHDCWFYTGKCCHYTSQACYKWKDRCCKCPQLKKYNKSWFFDRTSKMHHDKISLFNAIPRLVVVGVSDWILNEAKQSPVFQNATTFKRIYNWIDTEVFHPKNTEDLRNRLGLADKKIILSVASAWSKEKGIDTICKIAENLKDDEKYIVVGNIGENEFPNSVIQIPVTADIEELSRYYSLANVFIQPSLEETFGKVSAEALACGTPVICFNSTANPELIGHGCGYVVDAGNIDEVLSKIRCILDSDKTDFSHTCSVFATNTFVMESSLNEYLKLFSELVV